MTSLLLTLGVLHLFQKNVLCYLKNNQHLEKQHIHSKLFKELKNGLGILVRQAVFKLWIKTVKMLFGSITQELLSLPKF